MPKSKPFETVKINLDDVQDYTLSITNSTSSPKLTNWSSLTSQINVEGLKSFRAALISPYVNEAEDKIAALKNGHLIPLLQDLEKISKRQEFQDLPAFNDDFYNEVNKSIDERSSGFKSFLKSYSELTAEQHAVEKISAQMLINIGEKDITIDKLKANLESQLSDYKKTYSDQTKLDIGARQLILLKDKSGLVSAITIEELSFSKDISLTAEQKDFIKSSWQQGSFGGGWFSASVFKNNEIENKFTTFNQNGLLIDISEEDQVHISNQVKSIWTSADTGESLGSYATGTLIVDISQLKGETFTPGCASAKVRMSAIISKYDKEIDFIPAKLHQDNLHNFGRVVEYIEDCSRQGYYNTAKLADDRMSAMADSKLSSDNPMKYRAKIERFKSTEKDSVKIEEFAANQLDKFSSVQSKILDYEEKHRIKEALITILEPLCETAKEKTELRENAGKLVRQCADQAGKDMSWGEGWKNFKDKVKGFISNLIGKEDNVKKIVGKHTQAIENLKHNMVPKGIER